MKTLGIYPCTFSFHIIYACDYRLRLCHVENLGLSEINGSLSIEVSLHFGCKTICLPLTTKSINVSSFTAKWNEILEFNIKIQDIPKVQHHIGD